MQIVFVDWRIASGREEDFKNYWRSALPVNDRSQMVGEFLSEIEESKSFPWITWDMSIPDGTRFINVGLWANADAFHDQIGRYFNPSKGKESFEIVLRRRALLTPACWRMGDWKLPIHDNGGVL